MKELYKVILENTYHGKEIKQYIISLEDIIDSLNEILEDLKSQNKALSDQMSEAILVENELRVYNTQSDTELTLRLNPEDEE